MIMNDKKKEYGATFAYYSEVHGEFTIKRFEVQAADEFEARRLAWAAYDKCDDKPFMSCVRLCGVTWKASAPDAQGYFNALVAREKMAIREIEFVDYANDGIAEAKAEHIDLATLELAEKKRAEHSANCSSCYASLRAVTVIARDLYKTQGLIPPQVYEEIHYAKQLAGELNQYGEYGKEAALYKVIEQAEKWDDHAVFMLEQLFKGASIYLSDEYPHEYYAGLLLRGGVCPVYEDESAKSAYPIERRYLNAARVERLSQLPVFNDTHVIAGSEGLDYECKVLALKAERMNEPYQTPENLLWTPCEQDENGEPPPAIGKDMSAKFSAVNLITGEIESWKRSDFHGVLRPEFTDSINLDSLRRQYADERLCERLANQQQGDDEQDDENGDEWGE